MRSALVVASMGALVLGSAGGVATATPAKKVNDKPVLQVVNIRGHSPLNVFDVSITDGTTMSVRPLRLRATVRFKGAEAPQTISVTLDAYSRKVAGKDLTGPDEQIATQLLTLRPKKSPVNTYYWATHEFSVAEATAMKSLLSTRSKAYLCISAADVTGYDYSDELAWSTQTRKRLTERRAKSVRECVKIIDIDPALTDTTKDDPTPLPPLP